MLNNVQISQAKGMLARGDKQHEIAAHFGVNAGRIAEIATGRVGGSVVQAALSALPRIEPTGARFLDPNSPVEKQAAVLMSLIKAPPETARRVVITPELAEYILTSLCTNNRTKNAARVSRYADDMESGKWMLTGDTIKFGRLGYLRDGQHRLSACVRSGCAFETYIVFGIDDASFTVMDTGKVRGGDDVFKIQGIANGGIAANAMRWILILTSDRPTNRAATFDNRELLEAYKKAGARKIDAAVSEGVAIHRIHKMIPAGSLAALLYLFERKNPIAKAAFADDLRNSRGAAMKFVKRIEDLRVQSGGRMHENLRNALTVLTWQAYVAGRGLRSKTELSWNDTKDFPEI